MMPPPDLLGYGPVHVGVVEAHRPGRLEREVVRVVEGLAAPGGDRAEYAHSPGNAVRMCAGRDVQSVHVQVGLVA